MPTLYLLATVTKIHELSDPAELKENETLIGSIKETKKVFFCENHLHKFIRMIPRSCLFLF